MRIELDSHMEGNCGHHPDVQDWSRFTAIVSRSLEVEEGGDHVAHGVLPKSIHSIQAFPMYFIS